MSWRILLPERSRRLSEWMRATSPREGRRLKGRWRETSAGAKMWMFFRAWAVSGLWPRSRWRSLPQYCSRYRLEIAFERRSSVSRLGISESASEREERSAYLQLRTRRADQSFRSGSRASARHDTRSRSRDCNGMRVASVSTTSRRSERPCTASMSQLRSSSIRTWGNSVREKEEEEDEPLLGRSPLLLLLLLAPASLVDAALPLLCERGT